MEKESNLSINTVIVIPKNKDKCIYIINEGSKHIKRNDDMISFLIELCPLKNKQIRDLISRFRYFILYVKEKEIEELTFDFEYEIQKYRQLEIFNKILNYTNLEKEKNFNKKNNKLENFDNLFKKFSRK